MLVLGFWGFGGWKSRTLNPNRVANLDAGRATVAEGSGAGVDINRSSGAPEDGNLEHEFPLSCSEV